MFFNLIYSFILKEKEIESLRKKSNEAVIRMKPNPDCIIIEDWQKNNYLTIFLIVIIKILYQNFFFTNFGV